MDVRENENPFLLPSDEEVFYLREKERKIANEVRLLCVCIEFQSPLTNWIFLFCFVSLPPPSPQLQGLLNLLFLPSLNDKTETCQVKENENLGKNYPSITPSHHKKHKM